MYHTEIKNQVNAIKKSWLKTSFPPKDLQTGYTGDIDAYIATCTPFEQDIAHIFLKFRNAPSIKITNSFIAKQIRCSVRTVTRSTNKFHKDGFIAKHQPHQYSTNHYTLNDKVKKGKHAFSHWLNSLSPKNKDLYISHGIIIDHKNKIICSDVIPNNSSLILDSLFSRNVVLSSRAGARPTTKEQKTSYQKKGKKVNSVQKQLILDNRHDPLVKEMINNPELMSYIITPTIKKITELLSLDEKEQFKLTAFTDDALQYVYERARQAISCKKAPHVSNRMEWLIVIANEYCVENDEKPDWKWYYDLCDIIGIDPKTEPKKLAHKKTAATQKASIELLKPVLTFEQQYANLITEIENCKAKLANPHAYFKFCLKESIVYTEKRLAECLKDLEILQESFAKIEMHSKKESSNETQGISYQYSPDSMATYS